MTPYLIRRQIWCWWPWWMQDESFEWVTNWLWRVSTNWPLQDSNSQYVDIHPSWMFLFFSHKLFVLPLLMIMSRKLLRIDDSRWKSDLMHIFGVPRSPLVRIAHNTRLTMRQSCPRLVNGEGPTLAWYSSSLTENRREEECYFVALATGLCHQSVVL